MKKCPKCKRTYNDSWQVCLYDKEDLKSADEVAGEFYLGDLGSPRNKFLIVTYSILLILLMPLLMLMIYLTYFSSMEFGFRKSEGKQLEQAIVFEEEEEEEEKEGKRRR
jgi:hypothetical protein